MHIDDAGARVERPRYQQIASGTEEETVDHIFVALKETKLMIAHVPNVDFAFGQSRRQIVAGPGDGGDGVVVGERGFAAGRRPIPDLDPTAIDHRETLA